MKFNICGFDQSVLVELNEQHKDSKQQLDCTDLIILQWVADFFSRNSVKKVFIDGNLYAWVAYNNIVEDLPFISVNKRTFADRLDKLKAFGLIEKRVEKQKGYGTYLYIRMTSSYEELVYKKQENEGGCGSNTNGDAVQTPTKDYSTNNKIEKEEKENTIVFSKKKNFDFFAALLGIGIEEQIAKDWMKIRTSKKASDSETAFKQLHTALETIKNTHRISFNESISICVTNGWYGCKPSYFDNIKLADYGIGTQTSLFQQNNGKEWQ